MKLSVFYGCDFVNEDNEVSYINGFVYVGIEIGIVKFLVNTYYVEVKEYWVWGPPLRFGLRKKA